MSQIINPERRDPGYLKNKADVGLSRADNYSLSEIQGIVHGALREEYAKGDIYGVDEIKSLSEFLIPLCEFKDKSSRATITLGFINSSKEVISFVRADVKYSFLTEESLGSDTRGGERELSIELETSSERLLPGSFDLFKSSETNATLYYRVPKGVQNSSIGLYGVTVNITENLVTGEGSKNYKNIKLLNPSQTKKPSDFSENADYSIALNKTDRDTSSYSRSLAIYKEDEIYYPDNFSGENIKNADNYNFPKINGIPFTGDKKLTYDGNSLRDITITAKHSGEHLDEAGPHNWDVLNCIPVVGYEKTDSTNSEISQESVIKYVNTLDLNFNKYTNGLGKLVDIPRTISSNSEIGIWENLQNLQKLVNSVSPDQQPERIVSIGFLKEYTLCLVNLLSKMINNSSTSGEIYFSKSKEDSTPLSLLDVSPNYSTYVSYCLKGLKPNTSYQIILDEDFVDDFGNDILGIHPEGTPVPNIEKILTKCSITTGAGEENQESSVSQNFYLVSKSKNISRTSILNSNKLYTIKVQENQGGDNWVDVLSSSLQIRKPDDLNSIFYRKFNSNTYFCNTVLSSVVKGEKVSDNAVTIEEDVCDYSQYYDANIRSEVSLEKSKGLIWESLRIITETDPSSGSSISGKRFESGIILPPSSKGEYLSEYFIKGFSSDVRGLSAKIDEESGLEDVFDITVYRYNSDKKMYEKPTINEETKIIEEDFGYESIGRLDQNGNRILEDSEEHSFVIGIKWKNNSYENPSILEFKKLRPILINQSGITIATIDVYSKPSLPFKSTSTGTMKLYKDYTNLCVSRYIPITPRGFEDETRWLKDNFSKIPIKIITRDTGEEVLVLKTELIYTTTSHYKYDDTSTLAKCSEENNTGWFIHLISKRSGTYTRDESSELFKEEVNLIENNFNQVWNIVVEDCIYNNYQKTYPDYYILPASALQYKLGGWENSYNLGLYLAKLGYYEHETWFAYRYFGWESNSTKVWDNDWGEILIGEEDNNGEWEKSGDLNNKSFETFSFSPNFSSGDYYLTGIESTTTGGTLEEIKSTFYARIHSSDNSAVELMNQGGGLALDLSVDTSVFPPTYTYKVVPNFSIKNVGSNSRYLNDTNKIFVYNKDSVYLPGWDSKVTCGAKEFKVKLVLDYKNADEY